MNELPASGWWGYAEGDRTAIGIVVIVVVLASILYVTRRWWRRR
jgi:hypothetical protein